VKYQGGSIFKFMIHDFKEQIGGRVKAYGNTGVRTTCQYRAILSFTLSGRRYLQGIGVYFCIKVCRYSPRSCRQIRGKAPGKTLVESTSAISDTLRLGIPNVSPGAYPGSAGGSADTILFGSTGSYTKANAACPVLQGGRVVGG
jgi:hypothetical protein